MFSFGIKEQLKESSRGGLVVERWSDNRLDYHGGSNPIEVWCINRSEEETLCSTFI